MESSPIKAAFSKVKLDISSLESEVSLIKKEISEIKSMLSSLHETLNSQVIAKLSQNSPLIYPTQEPTFQQTNPTVDRYPTDTPTVPQEIGGLKTQNLTISTGNEGVPTDSQTVRQTNQQTQKSPFLPSQGVSTIESNILEASEILNSLDIIKKEIRHKFKGLTSQEMLVFSKIYELEEKDPQNNTYIKISSLLGLSESSIRDYTLKLIKKGIPIKKEKINNRKVLLSISPELKRIATLSTIIQLREL